MKKEIKDYLFLYLGCSMRVKGKRIATLTGISHDEQGKYFVHLKDREFGYYILFIQEAKPILRNLSDMTEKQKEWYGGRVTFDPNEFVWLLSEGYDLFGLIKSGLAIDKKTLK